MYKLYSSLDHRSAHLQKPLDYPLDPIDLSAGFGNDGVLLIFYAEQGTLRRTSCNELERESDTDDPITAL